MAGTDRELAKAPGWLGIFPSQRQDASQAPGTVPQGKLPAGSGKQVLRKRRERTAMSRVPGEEEAGGEYSAVRQLYGEGRTGESGSKWKQMGKFTGEEVGGKKPRLSLGA